MVSRHSSRQSIDTFLQEMHRRAYHIYYWNIQREPAARRNVDLLLESAASVCCGLFLAHFGLNRGYTPVYHQVMDVSNRERDDDQL